MKLLKLGFGTIALGVFVVGTFLTSAYGTVAGWSNAIASDRLETSNAVTTTSPTAAAPKPEEEAPMGRGNSCTQSNCGSGCSITCPANKAASCVCIKREVMCQGPSYGGIMPCYDYQPSCTCQ